MTAADLADLNGLLALEASDRAKAGDSRDKSVIADGILREIAAPDITPQLDALTEMMAARYAPKPNSPWAQ